MPTVSVGNIKNKPRALPRWKAREDIEKLCRMGTVNLAVEMGPQFYKRLFKEAAQRVLHADTKAMVGVPHSYRTFPVRVRLTKGRRLVNPARYLNGVVVTDQHFGDTVFAVTHWTNGAWNFKRKPFKKWRRRRWFQQEAATAAQVARWVDQGYNVVVGGDFNTGPLRSHVQLHPDQVLVERAGLMHLYAIPTKGYTVKALGRRVERDVHTDHPFLRAFIQFQKEKP